MRNVIDIYNSSMFYYKHITYIGSISFSFLIFLLLPYMQTCGDLYHSIIHYLLLYKSFFLYDSSILEFIHHIIQYKSSSLLYYHKCNPNITTSLKTTYSVLFTPIFNNLKIYVHPEDKYFRYFLDLCTFFSFFYYRTQFNILFWFGKGFTSIDEYILFNETIQNKAQTQVIARIMFHAFCLLNCYWGYKILKFVKIKTLHIIKHE